VPANGSAAQARLRAALGDALRRRDRAAVSALRSALSAIGNAEAVSPPPARAGAGSERIAGAAAGLGAGEASRRSLTAAEIDQIIQAEIGERARAADDYDRGGQPGPARRLRAEADVLRQLTASPQTVIEPVSARNAAAAVRFLAEWVSDGEADARQHLADHSGAEGASLAAVRDAQVVGIATILWESNYPGFAERGIPLLHQLAVAGPAQRQGVATQLMAAAEDLARQHGAVELGITVGLFDAYGPAQRLYARRGYLPDGRGACHGQEPLRHGAQVIMDHDLILWLTKALR
jgi:GNAT superfamily N-acetyltransferase